MKGRTSVPKFEAYKIKTKEGENLMNAVFKKKLLKKGCVYVLALMLLLGLTACGATVTPEPEEEAAPGAILEAQSWLAEQLAVSVDDVELVSSEQVEWPDSCFGLGGAAEICAAEATPGWRATYKVNSQDYEVRLNETGSLARSPQIP